VISKTPAQKISIQAPAGIPASMVVQYVERCIAGLPHVKADLDSLNYERLRVYGHGLKGSGGGYGIPRLSEVGALIEAAARHGDTAELQQQVAALETYLQQIQILPE
jgi:HPt (histidine-containing phosphotransfer) domain-containing protein